MASRAWEARARQSFRFMQLHQQLQAFLDGVAWLNLEGSWWATAQPLDSCGTICRP